MSSESVCQATRSWVDVDSFHARLVVRFMIFRVSQEYFGYILVLLQVCYVYTSGNLQCFSNGQGPTTLRAVSAKKVSLLILIRMTDATSEAHMGVPSQCATSIDKA
jgi:hypothetical protein